jgi:hypothetical protein
MQHIIIIITIIIITAITTEWSTVCLYYTVRSWHYCNTMKIHPNTLYSWGQRQNKGFLLGTGRHVSIAATRDLQSHARTHSNNMHPLTITSIYQYMRQWLHITYQHGKVLTAQSRGHRTERTTENVGYTCRMFQGNAHPNTDQYTLSTDNTRLFRITTVTCTN